MDIHLLICVFPIGELIDDVRVMQQLEDKYNANPKEYGSFMYYFDHSDRHYCIDATDKNNLTKGRLVNHSRINPNMRTKAKAFYKIMWFTHKFL